MPTKIASMKKANPSSTNGKPKTSPKRSISPGHRMPISKESRVPDTAPAANSTPIAFAQVWASSVSAALPRLCPLHSANTVSTGKAIPKQEKMMCHPSDSAICMRAGYRFSAASATTSNGSTPTSAPGSMNAGWAVPSADRVQPGQFPHGGNGAATAAWGRWSRFAETGWRRGALPEGAFGDPACS
jgi:hypothetical protein